MLVYINQLKFNIWSN